MEKKVINLTENEAKVIRKVLRRNLTDVRTELHSLTPNTMLYDMQEKEVNDILKALSYL